MMPSRRQVGADHREALLPDQARNWATPAARDWKGVSESQGRDLNRDARQWATPTVGNVTGGNANRGGDRAGELLLPGQAQNWQTPTVTDAAGRNYTYSSGNHDKPFAPLTGQATGRPGPATSTDGAPSSPSAPTSRRRLNPAFVTWLMGYPEGWLSLAPINCDCSETPSCPHRQRTP
ncbi:MAG: hypothetical protein NUW22_01155 [Acidobacteria bacterium]|nr:hypothetical protein [Acidobacteriota bacterium]